MSKTNLKALVKARSKILDVITTYEYASMFNTPDTKVRLNKSKKFGIELVCRKPIKKGEVIAYYRFKVYNVKTLLDHKYSVYNMIVINKNGNDSYSKIGVLYPCSLDLPENGITYYAFFSNEPSGTKTQNCYLDYEQKYNFKNRKVVKDGETMRYSIKAYRDIKKGEAIVYCYGNSYKRNYESNC